MILHLSIPAAEPRRVAAVLAELMQGQLYAFPGALREAFVAVSGEDNGTTIEVYPEHAMLVPMANGPGVDYVCNPAPPAAYPVHCAITVALDEAAVLAIAQREGWPAARVGRSAPNEPPRFHVIEFWLENRFMLELSTPADVTAYRDLFRLAMLDSVLPRLPLLSGSASSR